MSTRSNRSPARRRRTCCGSARVSSFCDVGVGDAVQQHVHLGDRPDAAVVLLARTGPGCAAFPPCSSTYSLDRMSMPPSPSTGRRPHARAAAATRSHHHPHDGARRVELAALLARRVGELADQVLVRGAEQVGELEVLVAQPVLGEVVDQVAQLPVRDRGLADLAGEVDVLDHALQRRVFVLLQRGERLVQPVADGLGVQLVPQVLPARLGRDEESRPRSRSAMSAALLRARAGPCPRLDMLGDQPLPVGLELIGAALQEQHPEDVLLELRGIHLAAQDVRRREQVPLQLRQRQPRHLRPLILGSHPHCRRGV